MAEPNDFTPKRVSLTAKQKRALAVAALQKAYGTSSNIESLSPKQIDDAAYFHLNQIMSKPSGTAELQTVLGSDATPVAMAYKEAQVPRAQPQPQGPLTPKLTQYGQPSYAPAQATSQADVEALIKGVASEMGIPVDVALTIFDMEHGTRNPDGTWERSRVPMTAEDEARNPGFIKAGDRARGPMQVMPGHFRAANIPENKWDDPHIGVVMALKILQDKYAITQDWRQAVKSYNGSGPEADAYLAKFDELRPERQAGVAGNEAPATGAAGGAGEKTRFLADIVGEPDAMTAYREAQTQFAALGDAAYQVDSETGAVSLSVKGQMLQDLMDAKLKEVQYGPKAGGKADLATQVADMEKVLGRPLTEQEKLRAMQLGGSAADEVGMGNLAQRREEFEYGKGRDVIKDEMDREKERQRILEMQTQLRMEGQQAVSAAKRDAMNRAGEQIRIPPGGFKFAAGPSGFTPAIDFGQYAAPFDYSGPVKEEEAKMAEILARLGAE